MWMCLSCLLIEDLLFTGSPLIKRLGVSIIIAPEVPQHKLLKIHVWLECSIVSSVESILYTRFKYTICCNDPDEELGTACECFMYAWVDTYTWLYICMQAWVYMPDSNKQNERERSIYYARRYNYFAFNNHMESQRLWRIIKQLICQILLGNMSHWPRKKSINAKSYI